MMQASVFAIHACGFIARCAMEADDAGEERLAKVIRIIAECRLGIHDLSRKTADAASGMSRFNMPFEMGVFMGAAKFGRLKKNLLVMEAERFDYQKFISDISGRDIRHHGNDPARVIVQIRDWLNAQRIVPSLPGGKAIVSLYEKFQTALPCALTERELAVAEIGPGCFINWADLVSTWLSEAAKG